MYTLVCSSKPDEFEGMHFIKYQIDGVLAKEEAGDALQSALEELNDDESVAVEDASSSSETVDSDILYELD